jgi:hypothetical protein
VADEFIYPEEINADALKKVFEDNYMDVSIDTDGEVVVTEDWRCYLRPDPDGRLVLVYASFGSSTEASEEAKLDYVNRVNDQVKLIRASVTASGKFFFDYYFSIEGGVSRRSIVMAVRRFHKCLRLALDEDTANVVA